MLAATPYLAVLAVGLAAALAVLIYRRRHPKPARWVEQLRTRDGGYVGQRAGEYLADYHGRMLDASARADKAALELVDLKLRSAREMQIAARITRNLDRQLRKNDKLRREAHAQEERLKDRWEENESLKRELAGYRESPTEDLMIEMDLMDEAPTGTGVITTTSNANTQWSKDHG